ncbi:MAG: Heat shock protein, Hsp20 family [Bacteroidetes bacterium]|nr:Heat shock protein, Hsp20 family [Bacteroidota bacterium]MDP2885232.1 Hsp20/alpha crystallin family protein [Ignavibacteria bacterium]
MMLRFDFPRTFNDLLEDTITTDFVSTAKSFPTMDIAEYQSEYVVIAEMPGVKKEDVKITFEKSLLTVQGQRKSFEIPQDARVLLNEMRVRDFSRSIRIPVEVDVNDLSAELENGMLRIVLPKAEEAKPKQIEVKVK